MGTFSLGKSMKGNGSPSSSIGSPIVSSNQESPPQSPLLRYQGKLSSNIKSDKNAKREDVKEDRGRQARICTDRRNMTLPQSTLTRSTLRQSGIQAASVSPPPTEKMPGIHVPVGGARHLRGGSTVNPPSGNVSPNLVQAVKGSMSSSVPSMPSSGAMASPRQEGSTSGSNRGILPQTWSKMTRSGYQQSAHSSPMSEDSLSKEFTSRSADRSLSPSSLPRIAGRKSPSQV